MVKKIRGKKTQNQFHRELWEWDALILQIFFYMIFFTHVTDFAEKDGLLVVHDFLNVC